MLENDSVPKCKKPRFLVGDFCAYGSRLVNALRLFRDRICGASNYSSQLGVELPKNFNDLSILKKTDKSEFAKRLEGE